MNILVLSWRDPKHPLAGGAEQVMHEHMKGWIEAGHKVTLFSSRINNLPKNDNIDEIKIIRQGYQYLGVQLEAFLYYLKNKNKYDLVVDQFHGIPFFTPLYVSKPILAVLQEVAKEVWFKNPLSFPLNYIVGFLGYVTEPLVFLFYRKCKFMVGSNSAKEDLMKYNVNNKNIAIVPHGLIGPNKVLKVKSQKSKTITFLGALSEDKGILDAIKTFEILSGFEKYNFWIIGQAESKVKDRRLRMKVKELNLQDKVKFWGRVDDDKKFDLLSQSFVLINPSIREGWGLVNIEANIVGTPVVAYPSQGLVDSVKHYESGILTKNSKPEDLAVAIKTLSDDTKKYDELSIGAKNWAKKFNWKRSISLSLKLINEIGNIDFEHIYGKLLSYEG